MKPRFLNVVAGLAILAVPIIAATSQSQPANVALSTQHSALSTLHREIESIEQQLTKVSALEAQVAQLEQTIAVMTPLLADRSRARRGDVNGDGTTDSRDLRIWSCCTGATPPAPNSACWFADVNVDGRVDTADRALIESAIKDK